MVKIPSSFRLEPENKRKLQALAKRENLTLGQFINKIIGDYAGKENKVVPNSEFNVINKRFEFLEKELAFQRQRINIFKNQVDFIIKSQNGKFKSSRYTKTDHPKQSLERYKK